MRLCVQVQVHVQGQVQMLVQVQEQVHSGRIIKLFLVGCVVLVLCLFSKS